MEGVIALNDINQKLKIAMIGHKRIPSREGGVEIVVEELSKRMVNNGHIVHAYNRKGHHVSGKQYEVSQIKLNEHKGIKIMQVPTIEAKGLAALSSSVFATIRAIFGKYDVIHFHAEGPCAMLWLPHLFGIRTIATIHGLDWQRAKWGKFASKYLKFGEKIAAKYADEVIVLSKNVQQYFLEVYNRKTKFIPNGIQKPTTIEAQIIREKWNINKDEYILFLGRIVPEKGLEYLVDAFKNVNTTKKIVIAGGASDTNEFMDYIKEKAKNDDRFIFTGFVQGKVLEELYSNAYIYVLPSDLEGMPISLLEAMSYGNCCVVSDIPECTEVIEKFGVSFKKGNDVVLSQKLQWLCDNEKVVEEYKNKASNFICSKYNWDDIVKRTLNLYKEENNVLTKDGEHYENLNG